MKAILLTRKGLVGCDKRTPKILRNEVLVDVLATGLCGSDIKKIRNPKEYADGMPLVLGHEVCGKSCNSVNSAILPFIGFKKLEHKREANFAELDRIGKASAGGFQEAMSIPRSNLFAIDSELSPIEATMADPLAVVLHGLKKIGQPIGSAICIIGDGTVALLAAQLLAKSNRVHVFGKYRHALKIAEGFGTAGSSFYSIEKYRDKFDIVIDAAGSKEALAASFIVSRFSGQVLIFGVYPASEIKINVRTPFYKELKIIGTNSYGYCNGKNEFQIALNMLLRKEIEVSPIITHVLRFSEFEKITDLISNRDREHVIKIVLSW